MARATHCIGCIPCPCSPVIREAGCKALPHSECLMLRQVCQRPGLCFCIAHTGILCGSPELAQDLAACGCQSAAGWHVRARGKETVLACKFLYRNGWMCAAGMPCSACCHACNCSPCAMPFKCISNLFNSQSCQALEVYQVSQGYLFREPDKA